MSKKKPIIGIDLGTTFSCAAVYKDGSAKVIFNDSGNYITPSCVSFMESEVLVGDEAVTQMPFNPENTVYDAKRLIGRQFNDPLIQEDIQMWPFKVKGINKRPQILISSDDGKRLIYPELVSALILMKMKEIAEKYLGQEVKDAVVTVPAYFNDAQRRATKDAGAVAGLNVLRIINEPTAAALAYGLENSNKEKSNVLVYDLGGGTFDVTVLTIESGIFEVKSTAGNTHLGGQDFTKRLVQHHVEDIMKVTNKNVATNKTAMAYLRSSCEAAKKSLSFRKKANVILKYDDYAYSTSITQALFEELNDDLFKSTLTYVQHALDDAKMTVSDIDEVVLVGGSTRIPKIQELLKEFFEDKNLNHSLNPDEGVALGAAIQAALMDEHDADKIPEVLLVDVTPMSLGIETYIGDMSVIIERHTVIPKSLTSLYQTAEDDQPWIRIGVYEGEKTIAKENNLLDEFRLENLPPGPKGTVKIEVTFDINADGILTVTAVELSKGIKKSIVVTNVKEYLSKEEIDRMVKNVEKLKCGE